jgi:hypothetical protein
MTMNNIVNKNNISINNTICNERQKSISQMQTSNISENDTACVNMWNWPISEYLSVVDCYSQDPISDGNCLIRALLMCTFHSNTTFDCFMLRSQINDFLLGHPSSYLSDFIPIIISPWAHDNLINMGKSINELDNPLLLYTEMMRDATPGTCEY